MKTTLIIFAAVLIALLVLSEVRDNNRNELHDKCLAEAKLEGADYYPYVMNCMNAN